MLAKLAGEGLDRRGGARPSSTRPMSSCATSSTGCRWCATSRRITLPRDRGELARIGAADAAMPMPAAFEAELRTHAGDGRAALLGAVRKRRRTFRRTPAASSSPAARTIRRRWRRCGSSASPTPRTVTETVRGWHFGRFAAMRSTAARESLTEITPALLQAFSRAGNPDAAVRAFDSLLKALPAGAQLFALLRNNPDLLDLLATILSAAPRLAEIFARRPHVVDALLDPSRLARRRHARRELRRGARAKPRGGAELRGRARPRAALRGRAALPDLRRAAERHARRRPMRERRSPISPRRSCAALFQRTLARVRAAARTLRRTGEPPILAFGRLGSREMTAGSDLDLIIIYDHAPDAGASDGARPLPPSQYYTRLTQRLIAALSAPTAEGIAYAVDLRLRPSGPVRAARHAYRGVRALSAERGLDLGAHGDVARPRHRRRCRADAAGRRACSTRWSRSRAIRRRSPPTSPSMRGAHRAREGGGERLRREARARRADRLRVRRAVSGARRARPRRRRDDAGDAGARSGRGADRARSRASGWSCRPRCRARCCRSRGSPTRRAFRLTLRRRR